MNQLIKNRLIGGAVIVCAALFFIPAILTPNEQAMTNPNLTINRNDTKAVTQPHADKHSAETDTAMSGTSGDDSAKRLLTLESVDADSSGAAPTNSNNHNQPQQLAIQLESSEPSVPETVSSNANTLQTIAVQQAKAGKERWVRVGSFSNVANASKLVKGLQSQGLPVHVKSVTVSGKTFTRVLLGPFSSDTKMRAALQKMNELGLSPSIQ